MSSTCVTVHTITYNEEALIEFFIKHYREKFPHCIIRVYDNYSTDKTVEIAKQYGCEVYYYDSGDTLDDREYLKIKNHAWKDATTDWVIVCDADEMIEIEEKDLIFLEKTGVNLVKFTGYTMVNREGVKKFEDIKTGFRDTEYDKILLFNKKNVKEINYEFGAHAAKPCPGFAALESTYNLYHYKYIGKEYSLKRKKLFSARVSKNNREKGHGVQYFLSDKHLEEKGAYHMSISYVYDKLELKIIK